MDDVLLLTLGGKEWRVAPLPYRQVRKIFGVLKEMQEAGNADAVKALDLSVSVIGAALEKDHPTDAAALDDFPLRPAEIYDATQKIFRFAGLEIAEAPAGEAPAPA